MSEEHRDREGRHHRQIEQNGAAAAAAKRERAFENAAVQGDQRDQQKIGEGDARELYCQSEALGIRGKSRRQQLDHRRRENERDDQQDDLACKQQGEHTISEELRRIGATLLADARIGWDEGRVERTLGENRAEMIWQPQRDEKRIRDRSSSEHGREHNVPRKARDARYQRQAADSEDAPDHWPRPLFCDRPRSIGKRRPSVLHNPGDSAMELTGTPHVRLGNLREQRRSGSEGASHRRDDPVLRRLVEIGVHRQADHLLRHPLAHRRPAFGHRKTLGRLLTVERDRIVDRGRNALRLDRSRKRIALTGGRWMVYCAQTDVEPGASLGTLATSARPAEYRRATRSRADDLVRKDF